MAQPTASNAAPQMLEDSLLHKLLVGSSRLQKLPAIMVAGLMIASAFAVGWVWLHLSPEAGLLAGLMQLVASAANWGMLRALPRVGRSYGPDKPSALALALLLALGLVVIGIFAASTSALIVAVLAALTLTLIAFYATWIEPFRLGVTRQTLTLPNANGACLRLLHLSDLHLERETLRERRLNALIDELKPDLIVFSGDFVNLSYTWDEQTKADIRRVISAWRAPMGVYCVPGTPIVEPLPRVLEFVQGLDNLTLLTNRWTMVETPCGALNILGLVTTHDLPTDRRALAEQMPFAPEQGAALLLAHSPDIAPEAAAAGFDLYLCGHTHGGQIRFPLVGAVFSASQLGKRFVMGRYPLEQMTLYVARGIGMEGYGAPRARFLCPPEIVLWEIQAQGEQP